MQTKTEAPRLHGIVYPAHNQNGRLYFGAAVFVQQLKQLYGRVHNAPPDEGPFNRKFIYAAENFLDTVWKIDRIAELFDNARKTIRNLDDGITAEDIAAHQGALKDIPIYLETLIIYLRILADALAKLTPYHYATKRALIPDGSFRKQRKWLMEKCPDFDPKYRQILERHSKWFDTLAGNAKEGGHGLRDAIIHYSGAIQLIYRPGTTKSEPEVIAHLYTISKSAWALVPTLKGLVSDLFVFLDNYVRHFNDMVLGVDGTSILDLEKPGSTVLFEFEDQLPSSWLYPTIVSK